MNNPIPILIFLFFLEIGFFVCLTYVHEETHKAIFESFTCEIKEVDYNPFTAHVTADCSKLDMETYKYVAFQNSLLEIATYIIGFVNLNALVWFIIKFPL